MYTQSEAEEVPGWCVLPPLPVLLCLVFHGDAVDAVDTDTDDDDDDNEDCDRSRRRSGVFVHDEDENERKEDTQTHRRLFLLLRLSKYWKGLWVWHLVKKDVLRWCFFGKRLRIKLRLFLI